MIDGAVMSSIPHCCHGSQPSLGPHSTVLLDSGTANLLCDPEQGYSFLWTSLDPPGRRTHRLIHGAIYCDKWPAPGKKIKLEFLPPSLFLNRSAKMPIFKRETIERSEESIGKFKKKMEVGSLCKVTKNP